MTLLTELPQEAATQMLSISNTRAEGDVSSAPILTVSRASPSRPILEIVFSELLSTHMCRPSKGKSTREAFSPEIAYIPAVKAKFRYRFHTIQRNPNMLVIKRQ